MKNVNVRIIFQIVLAGLILAGVTTGSTSIVKTFINEANILNIYDSLKEIKHGIDKLDSKIEKLR